MILQTVYLGAMSGNLALTYSSESTIAYSASEIFSDFIKFGAGIFPRINLARLRLNMGKFACKLYIVQLSYGAELKNSKTFICK